MRPMTFLATLAGHLAAEPQRDKHAGSLPPYIDPATEDFRSNPSHVTNTQTVFASCSSSVQRPASCVLQQTVRNATRALQLPSLVGQGSQLVHQVIDLPEGERPHVRHLAYEVVLRQVVQGAQLLLQALRFFDCCRGTLTVGLLADVLLRHFLQVAQEQPGSLRHATRHHAELQSRPRLLLLLLLLPLLLLLFGNVLQASELLQRPLHFCCRAVYISLYICRTVCSSQDLYT